MKIPEKIKVKCPVCGDEREIGLNIYKEKLRWGRTLNCKKHTYRWSNNAMFPREVKNR